jgi:hypothetical protein
MAAQAAAHRPNGGIGNLIKEGINGQKVDHVTAQAAIAEVPVALGDFLAGFVSKYLSKVVLEAGEKECITRNVKNIASDTVSVLSTSITSIIALTNQKTPNMFALTGAAAGAMNLVTSMTGLIKSCVKADWMAVMEATKAHLMQPAYVQGRLLANGLKITEALADSIAKAEADKWEEVGGDIGEVMRDTLLDDSSGVKDMKLPAGCMEQNNHWLEIHGAMPAEITTPAAKTQYCGSQVGPDIANGVVKGIFVKDTSVTITDAMDDQVNIFVDLKRCVADESETVTKAINSLYLVATELICQAGSLGKPQAADGAAPQTPQCQSAATGMSEGMQGLSASLTNIPLMLSRCGVDAAQMADMKEAFKDMANLKVAFTIPGPNAKAAAAAEAAQRLSKATEFWDQGEYDYFGLETGGLIRDLILAMFPSQTAASFTAAPTQLYDWQMAHLADEQKPAGSLALYVGGFSLVGLLAMALMRVFPKQTGHQPTLLQTEDQEEAWDVEDIE